MTDAPQIDLAGLVRERESADARLKLIAADIVRELLATSDDALTPRLRELKHALIEGRTTNGA